MEDGMSRETDTTPDSDNHHEFGREDYDLFKKLANRMHYFAFLLGILALLGVPAIIGGNAVAALVTLLYTMIGILTVGAANALRRIVTTDGSGISELMAALGSVNNLLTFSVILVTILLAVGAGGIFVAYVLAVL